MKSKNEQDTIDTSDIAFVKPPCIEVTEQTVGALNHFMFIDFNKFTKERHALYLKARQLTEYRHTPEPVQEAAQKLVDAMKIVGEAQVDLGTTLAIWSSER